MYQGIDPDYYGFRDEEDGVLLKVEKQAEEHMRRAVSVPQRACNALSTTYEEHFTFQFLTCVADDACNVLQLQ